MSRLIVKNLPNNVTADKVKEKFSEIGRVTDVQLKYTPDGKFRKFGFIGYESEKDAKEAINYFHRSFMGTSRLHVEQCSELGDANKPKAWSKYAVEKTKKEELEKEKKKKDAKEKKNKNTKGKTDKLIDSFDKELVEEIKKYRNDPDFIEFMTLHGQTSILKEVKGSEDESEGEEKPEEEEKDDEEEENKQNLALSNISDAEYLKAKIKKTGDEPAPPVLESLKKETPSEAKKMDLFSIKISNLPYKVKKQDIKGIFAPLVPASIGLCPKIKGIAYVRFKQEKDMRRALVKNKTFFNGRQLTLTESKKPKEAETKIRKSPEEYEQADETIAESGRIFIRNLSYSVTENEIKELFSKHGPVTEVIVPIDKITRKVKGYGLVTFLMPEHAVAAFTALDGTIFHGRMLHLLPGKSKTEEVEDDEPGGNFKSKKKKKQKATAGLSHNWNALFLGQNAIAEVMAETYNATKEQVLTGKDAAVRLALGETQLVMQTREFLEKNGVMLDAFNKPSSKRSTTAILVKNLPAKTIASELREMFAKFGELNRVVLPPSGITGIVEFQEPSEARRAFTNLAYTKFKHIPLYLEWAPDGTFSSDSPVKTENREDEESTRTAETEVKEEEDEESEDLVPEPDATLYVKNLNFNTTDESLKRHFEPYGKVSSCLVAKKKDPSQPGSLLSMGYGFVHFYTKASADQALKELQGSSLDDHVLELKRSNRTLKAAVVDTRKDTNVQKQTGSKILVRNIPFQATQNEIRDLFKTFGHLKSVRLPKKLVGTGPHRGFGFVEFGTKHDAKRAMKALCQSTHIFGRRLVLEWAELEEDLDTIRKRTAQHFHPDNDVPQSKKATANLMDTEVNEEEM